MTLDVLHQLSAFLCIEYWKVKQGGPPTLSYSSGNTVHVSVTVPYKCTTLRILLAQGVVVAIDNGSHVKEVCCLSACNHTIYIRVHGYSVDLRI